MTILSATTDTLVEWTRADCSPFLNWDEEELESVEEWATFFRSLVATVKLQPTVDVSLETKAVKWLKYMDPRTRDSADAFLGVLASALVIATAAMQMFGALTASCSTKMHLLLVKADLIPQIIVTSTLQSLSFEKVKYIHTYFISIIVHSFWLATPDYLAKPTFKDEYEQQAVHETVLKQVLSPLELYISHLCVNRYSIVERDLSAELMKFIAHILQTSLVYQPAMDFVLNLPNHTQRDLNEERGEMRRMGKIVDRMLRMEGIEDVIDEKLQNDRNGSLGGRIVAHSIKQVGTSASSSRVNVTSLRSMFTYIHSSHKMGFAIFDEQAKNGPIHSRLVVGCVLEKDRNWDEDGRVGRCCHCVHTTLCRLWCVPITPFLFASQIDSFCLMDSPHLLHLSLLLSLSQFDLKILMSVNANEARQRVCQNSETDEEEHQREVHKDASGTIELEHMEDFKLVRSGERNLPSVEQQGDICGKIVWETGKNQEWVSRDPPTASVAESSSVPLSPHLPHKSVQIGESYALPLNEVESRSE
ncbi:hypothetical protein BLNAU_14569 [Blattamonas nauphoetae]|uniref:Uncharacterized protein n=1 Tax=Blattamonas nauphoetae TaxID=2049346 RepID=A0ABQ9XD71_9EUKA|nr:hypothetical protein BLNAU_14569 [Blattamonas nauphoetae]